MKDMNTAIVYCTVFAAVFVPYLFLSMLARAPKTTVKELNGRRLPSLFRWLWRVIAPLSELVGSPLSSLQPVRATKLADQIATAGIRMSAEHVLSTELLLSIAFSFGLIAVTLVLTRDVGKLCAAFCVGGLLGFSLPSISVAKAAEARQTAIMKALPFAIDLIGSAMRSGIDFSAAVRYYVTNEDKTAPLAVEFGVMLREVELGKTRSEALEEMALRIRHDGFTAFKDAVVHGLEIGASIVGTMKVQAEELRRIRFNAAERKAARAVSSMIFPIALFIMPAMFLIIGTPILIRVFNSGLGGILK